MLLCLDVCHILIKMTCVLGIKFLRYVSLGIDREASSSVAVETCDGESVIALALFK